MTFSREVRRKFTKNIEDKIGRGDLPIPERYIVLLYTELGLTMVPNGMTFLHDILSETFQLVPDPNIENVIRWIKPEKEETKIKLPENPVTRMKDASPRISQKSPKKNSDGQSIALD